MNFEEAKPKLSLVIAQTSFSRAVDLILNKDHLLVMSNLRTLDSCLLSKLDKPMFALKVDVTFTLELLISQSIGIIYKPCLTYLHN